MNIPSADTDAWNAAEGTLNNKPSLLRFRPNLEAYLGDPAYPRRLSIFWEFEEGNDSGMPSPEQSDEMRVFEDAIVNTLDQDRCSILAFVLTNSGIREWHFYVSDVNEVGNRINQALSDFPKLPITLQVEDDPNWEELRQVYAQCK